MIHVASSESVAAGRLSLNDPNKDQGRPVTELKVAQPASPVQKEKAVLCLDPEAQKMNQLQLLSILNLYSEKDSGRRPDNKSKTKQSRFHQRVVV